MVRDLDSLYLIVSLNFITIMVHQQIFIDDDCAKIVLHEFLYNITTFAYIMYKFTLLCKVKPCS